MSIPISFLSEKIKNLTQMGQFRELLKLTLCSTSISSPGMEGSLELELVRHILSLYTHTFIIFGQQLALHPLLEIFKSEQMN